jgi:hypothetical protein
MIPYRPFLLVILHFVRKVEACLFKWLIRYSAGESAAKPEAVFLDFYGAQESIPRNRFLQPLLPGRFQALIDCSKFQNGSGK